MARRAAAAMMLALAGLALSGCVAAAIPALAGTALFGTQIDRRDPAPAAMDNAEAVALLDAPTIAIVPTRPAPAPAPAPVPAPGRALPPVTPPITAGRPDAPPAEALAEIAADRRGFARFVRYGRDRALAASTSAAPLSAMLSDPVALDGRRRPCLPDEQPVALIDLDPSGRLFAPPAEPAPKPGLALGLAVLREAGVVIAWLSDLPLERAGAVRQALERAGLDPRGQDILSLRRDGDDRKQLRKDNLAATACIVAIAGDERPDFDERYRYLRNPRAGSQLDLLIDDGWFLIDPIF